MNLALGRFHLAIYLDAPDRHPLVSSSVAQPDLLTRTYQRESRHGAVAADRERWSSSYAGRTGWRM